MAKVSLRVYNREIESMIEGGRLDEAVAHCQHILQNLSHARRDLPVAWVKAFSKPAATLTQPTSSSAP